MITICTAFSYFRCLSIQCDVHRWYATLFYIQDFSILGSGHPGGIMELVPTDTKGWLFESGSHWEWLCLPGGLWPVWRETGLSLQHGRCCHLVGRSQNTAQKITQVTWPKMSVMLGVKSWAENPVHRFILTISTFSFSLVLFRWTQTFEAATMLTNLNIDYALCCNIQRLLICKDTQL